MKKILSTILGIFIIMGIYAVNISSVLAQGASSVGVKFEGDCLMGMGQDCFEYETMAGLSGYQPGAGYTTTSVVQDVFFTATYIVGAVLTIVIIWCGLGYVFASSSSKGKDAKDYQKGLVKAALGAVLVRGAYAIVRLIQYIAKG